MILSKRLLALRNYYHHARTIWDIGCDHGLLGLSFLDQPEVREIHLVDPSDKVIKNLKAIVDSHITKQELYLHQQRGQDLILNSASKIIFIAGMGGKEIREIIDHLLPQLTPADRLCLSPHKNLLELRKHLASMPIGLIAENLVQDLGRYYQVLCLASDSKLPRVSHYGEAIWRSPEGKGYREQQLRHFSAHRDHTSQKYTEFLKGLSA